MQSNYTFKSVGLALILSIFLLNLCIPARMTAQTNSLPNKLFQEEQFVLINGIEQWVTIKGTPSKPIILFLHGGPGSPISPYSDALYQSWEADFIIVQWDQRGAGKTYGRNAPEELTPEFLIDNPLTIEQMTADGIALSEYLIKHLNQEKIILFGTSWGSLLGVNMASQRPDLFYAYVGHSQVVNPAIDLPLYDKIYQMATTKKDSIALNLLHNIGKPPFARAKSAGQFLRLVKQYENANTTPAPKSWFIESAEYDNPKDNQNRSDGDDYSFVNYVGDARLGIKSMGASMHLMENLFTFKIPVYLIQGEADLLTPGSVTKKYFKKIKAPKKRYYLLPKTGHGFNQAVLATQYKIFKQITR